MAVAKLSTPAEARRAFISRFGVKLGEGRERLEQAMINAGGRKFTIPKSDLPGGLEQVIIDEMQVQLWDCKTAPGSDLLFEFTPRTDEAGVEDAVQVALAPLSGNYKGHVEGLIQAFVHAADVVRATSADKAAEFNLVAEKLGTMQRQVQKKQ
jgi:hypothetical protein